MATDLPEYKRQVGISPAGSSGSFQTAMQGVAQSELTLGAMGAEIAQTAANERARLEGIQTAHSNPGRELFPAFTQSDKAFVQAYKAEEYNTLLYEGQQYLNSSFAEAMKNPSSKSLNAYQTGAQKALDGITGRSQADLAPELKRSLAQMYEGKYSQLANAVEAKNKAYMAANFKRSYGANLENTYNFHLQGMHEAAKGAYEQSLNSIRGAMAQGLISVDQAATMEKEAKINNQSAYYQYKGIQAQEEGTGDEFLKQLLVNQPEHLSPIEHLQVMGSTQKMLGQRQSYMQGQQQIDYIHAQTDLANGTLTATSLIDYQEKLSPQDFAKLELKMATQTAAAIGGIQTFNKMVGSFSDPAAMSQYSSAEMDSTFAKLVEMSEMQTQQQTGQPYKASLLDEASLAQNIKRDIPSLNKKLSASMQYGGPADAAMAAQAYRMLNENNPSAIQSMDTNAKAVAKLFDAYSRNTSYSADDSLKAARNDIYNVDENKKTERTAALKQWKSDKGLMDYKSKANYIAKNLDAKHFFSANEKVPAGLNTVFDDLMQSMVLRVGDPDIAAQMVFDEIKKVYKHTETNGRTEIMAIPPESVLPNVGHFVENDKVRALKQYVEANQAVQAETGFVFNDISWPDAPDTSDLLSKPLVKGDLKVIVDGKPRKIVIISDAVTQMPTDGLPSWSFNYIDDNGIEVPLMDIAGKSGVARWRPDVSGIERQQQEYEAAQLREAMEIRNNPLHPKRTLFERGENPNVDSHYKPKKKEGDA